MQDIKDIFGLVEISWTILEDITFTYGEYSKNHQNKPIFLNNTDQWRTLDTSGYVSRTSSICLDLLTYPEKALGYFLQEIMFTYGEYSKNLQN